MPNRKKTIAFLLLLSVVVLVVVLFCGLDNDNKAPSPISPYAITVTPILSDEVDKHETDIRGILTPSSPSSQETSKYGGWGFNQSDFRILPPSVSDRAKSNITPYGICETTYTEGNFKFFSQTHCFATDEQNNTWVIPFPFWVDACKFIKISHPSIKQQTVLTVTNLLSSVVQIEPGEEKACCMVGDRCYDIGDPFPVNHPPCLYVIDITWNGQEGFLIGGDMQFTPYTWCWIQIDKGRVLTQTLKTYKPQYDIPPGWSAYGNILYFHKSSSDTCVDMSKDVPVEKTCQ